MTGDTIATAAVVVILATVGLGWSVVQIVRLHRSQPTAETPAPPKPIAPVIPWADLATPPRQIPDWTNDPTTYEIEFLDIADELSDLHDLFHQIVAIAETEEKSQ